jgi:hypothetical protein
MRPPSNSQQPYILPCVRRPLPAHPLPFLLALPQIINELTLSDHQVRLPPGLFAEISRRLDGALRAVAGAYPAQRHICVDDLRAFATAVDG